MTLQVILFTFIMITDMCTFCGLDYRANGKNFGFQMTMKQVIDDTTSLFEINKSNLHENMLVQGVNTEFNKMNRIPRMVNESNASAQYFSGDLSELNATFEEKKREDAFEKKPAAESPHAVLIIYTVDKSSSLCSGSFITADWVLTAAHCLPLSSEVLVYAGVYSLKEVRNLTLAKGAQVRSGKTILPHPKYENKGNYDIGLIQVNASFDITDTVKPVGISTEPWNHRGYRKCQITGFGAVLLDEERPDDHVRKTHTLDVKKPCLCSFRLKKIYDAARVSRFLCARPREDYGVCGGDSGGGLLCDGQIRAVAMMIAQLKNMNRTCTNDLILFKNPTCGSENTLSIFQDSCPFLPWINSHVRLFNDSQISGECVDRSVASKPLRAASNLFLAFAVATAIFNRIKC